MVQSTLIIVVFFVLALLMMLRKIPTFLAMILLAVITCIIARVPIVGTNDKGAAIGWLQTIIEAGSVRMASAIAAIIFGSWLGQLLNRTGVTEAIIKKSAELGGDRPLVVALILVVANALLFTTLSGLGSVIMVGSIILPILISVGIPASTAAGIFLMSFNVGLTFNMVNWQTFTSIFSLDIETIQRFEVYMLVATAIATVVYVLVEFGRNGRKFAFAAPVNNKFVPKQDGPEDVRPLKGITGVCAILTPVIPIILVIALKIPVVPAFIAGILWILIFTAPGFTRAMNMLMKTCYDGFTAGAPAMILFVSLGMLLLAVTNPMVKEILNPFLLAVVPSGRIVFIFFFALLAPLSLYRGPLNLFGLGSGIAALVIGLGTLNPLAVMGAFLSAERIQGCGDPTNTQNVWTANFAEVDVNSVTKNLLPYLWIIAIIGVITTGIIFF
ncbi:MAG: C4-dicarboxylate ABC transporter [Spirochaetaceae bacterium]|nr:C4-dicarboxylate ABC transporter [Spirochaetaceae bacterium]